MFTKSFEKTAFKIPGIKVPKLGGGLPKGFQIKDTNNLLQSARTKGRNIMTLPKIKAPGIRGSGTTSMKQTVTSGGSVNQFSGGSGAAQKIGDNPNLYS